MIYKLLGFVGRTISVAREILSKSSVSDNETYVVKKNYVNGEPSLEVLRTRNRSIAEEWAHSASGDFDPFLRDVTIDTVPG